MKKYNKLYDKMKSESTYQRQLLQILVNLPRNFLCIL